MSSQASNSFQNLLLTFALFGAVSAATCVKPGQTVTASWRNAQGKTCTFTGAVGSNFGRNAVNGGDYSCNGRCGAGCTGFALNGNQYTLACYTHDVCSWFNNASGGASDPNCGAAFTAAQPDFFSSGCTATNPSKAAQRPSTTPVCR
ncbi:hypothetical protein EDD86DRAFT_112968 [Gorgonomyces haynaldii]|nr:hypothetical protein EDD86DRAFT_112968 [Gorgonomyces haynaldii]